MLIDDPKKRNARDISEAKKLGLENSKIRNELCWKQKLNFEETMDWTFSWYSKVLAGGDPAALTRRQIKIDTKSPREQHSPSTLTG